MVSNIDAKMKLKLTWQITEHHEIIIRMQGAKTSKIMLPCQRHVHLHKSDSFKTIFEQILTNLNK